jgi:hypothetical protein
MKKPMCVLLAAVVTLAFGVAGRVVACPPGGDAGNHGPAKCDPATCKGHCDPATCKGRGPGGCDPATCDPENCKGCCPGCPGHGKGLGARACGPQGMLAWMDYGMMPDEHRARLLQGHPEIDTDADGVLSETEFEAFRAKRVEEHRARVLEHHPEADTDGDGVLSDAEFEAFRAKRMEERRAMILERHPEADTDGSGTLSNEEARTFFRSHPGCFGGVGERGQEHPCGNQAPRGKGPCHGYKPANNS